MHVGKIHENIILLRKKKGYTQKIMADKLQISESTYNRLENQEIDLAYARHLLPIAKAFDMEVDDLFIFNNRKYVEVKEFTKMREAFKELKKYFE